MVAARHRGGFWEPLQARAFTLLASLRALGSADTGVHKSDVAVGV